MQPITKKYTTPHNPFEYTFGEIASKLGISKERVRQIEYQALRKIRKNSKVLKDYIEGDK
jgi:DNA-directed RNA polymerase sigma subunit (sigma70/sigma32)